MFTDFIFPTLKYLREVFTQNKKLKVDHPDLCRMGGEETDSEKLEESAGPLSKRGLFTQLKKTPTNSKPSVQRSVAESMNEVLSNDLLREMIVGQVLQNEIRRGSSREDLRSLRLVSKSWLLDASKYLLKCGYPLFRIRLPNQNTPNAFPGATQVEGLFLEQFTSAMLSPTRLYPQMPPIRLTLCLGFFRHTNHQSFSNFLTSCASALVEVNMFIPWNGGSMTFLFPGVNLTFPNLHNIILSFSSASIQMGDEESWFSAESNVIAIPFLQSLLNGTGKIKQLQFPFATAKDRMYNVPHGVRFLTLPPTLTALNVASFTNSCHLEALLNYDLPHLRTLVFCILGEPLEDDLVSQILEKFRASLRNLVISDADVKWGPEENSPTVTDIRFPLMEKLEKLQMTSRYAQLEEGHRPLQNSLPNLEFLHLPYQSIAKMQKWVESESSTFPNVSQLVLSPTKEDSDESGGLHALNLKRHFPNLTCLTVFFEGDPGAGDVTHIFEEMTQLNVLKLSMKISDGTGDHWESLLTGIPVGLVRELRLNPEFLPNFQLNEQKPPPILNMKELECLVLQSPSATKEDAGEILISDLSLHCAFQHIPSLKELFFEDDLKATPEMARAWRERGCTLTEMKY